MDCAPSEINIGSGSASELAAGPSGTRAEVQTLKMDPAPSHSAGYGLRSPNAFDSFVSAVSGACVVVLAG